MVATRASNHRSLKSNYYTATDIGIFLSHYTIVRAMVNENHSVIVCLLDKVSNLNPKITSFRLLAVCLYIYSSAAAAWSKSHNRLPCG